MLSYLASSTSRTHTATGKNVPGSIMVAISAACVLLFTASPTQAQSYPPTNVEGLTEYPGFLGDNGQSTTTLRNPLAPVAASTPAGVQAVPGEPPPIGSGSTPLGINPGMGGSPIGPPSNMYPQTSNSGAFTNQGSPVTNFYMQPAGPLDVSSINQQLSPYLQDPPSTPGADSSWATNGSPLINSRNNGQSIPPVDGNAGLGANGGITGNAPLTKTGWNGQKTRDLSRNVLKAKNSTAVDFGQEPYTLRSQSGGKVNYAQDGPRALTFNWTVPSSPTYSTSGEVMPSGMNYHSANLAPPSNQSPNSAQLWKAPTATQNWYGERQTFKYDTNGQALPPQQTIAPY